MSNTIDKKDLLGWLDGWYDYCREKCIPECVGEKKECEQAYEQIMALIKSGNE